MLLFKYLTKLLRNFPDPVNGKVYLFYKILPSSKQQALALSVRDLKVSIKTAGHICLENFVIG